MILFWEYLLIKQSLVPHNLSNEEAFQSRIELGIWPKFRLDIKSSKGLGLNFRILNIVESECVAFLISYICLKFYVTDCSVRGSSYD